jgi:hypothetical protein
MIYDPDIPESDDKYFKGLENNELALSLRLGG